MTEARDRGKEKEAARTNPTCGIWASHCFLACFPLGFPSR